MTVMLTYNVCVGTCHHSSFVVISSCKYQTSMHAHTHTQAFFPLSLCVQERWHLNCHWGEGKVVSQGSRGQPLCWMVFESLENKSCCDEISSQWPVSVTMRVCARCDTKNATKHVSSKSICKTKPNHAAAQHFRERSRGKRQLKVKRHVSPMKEINIYNILYIAIFLTYCLFQIEQ